MPRLKSSIESGTGRLGTVSSHPIKLVVDVVAISAAMLPLRSHHWLMAVTIAIVPSLLITMILLALRARTTAYGSTGWRQLLRLAVLLVAVWAAWTHHDVTVIAALAVNVILVLLESVGNRGNTGPI